MMVMDHSGTMARIFGLDRGYSNDPRIVIIGSANMCGVIHSPWKEMLFFT